MGADQCPLHARCGGERHRRRGTTRDNTERQNAEQELRLAARVLEDSGEAIMITDPHAIVLKVNQAFTRITGYAAGEVIGRNARLLRPGGRMPRSMPACGDRSRKPDTGAARSGIAGATASCSPSGWGISSVRDTAGEITHFVGIFTDISERKATEAKIAFLAHDPLTGLPNRLLLKDRTEQAMAHAERSKRKVALLFVDLDRFKAVNDSFGHPVGDTLLRDAAQHSGLCARL